MRWRRQIASWRHGPANTVSPRPMRADGRVVRGVAVVADDALGIDADDARVILLPLRVNARTVGVLRVSAPEPIARGAARRRFLGALAYYAALGVERLRLETEADHAGALREADRMKDFVLASVSHDLRTPLTAIKALAHDAAGRGEPSAVVIEEQADRLGRMVGDLLDLSRMKAGPFPVRSRVEYRRRPDWRSASPARTAPQWPACRRRSSTSTSPRSWAASTSCSQCASS